MNKEMDRESNDIYVGKKPLMSYALAALLQFNAGNSEVTIKARGRSISHAVDVAEILINKFYPSAYYKDIRISTEHLNNDDGKVSNVSSMEIVLGPKKS